MRLNSLYNIAHLFRKLSILNIKQAGDLYYNACSQAIIDDVVHQRESLWI